MTINCKLTPKLENVNTIFCSFLKFWLENHVKIRKMNIIFAGKMCKNGGGYLMGITTPLNFFLPLNLKKKKHLPVYTFFQRKICRDREKTDDDVSGIQNCSRQNYGIWHSLWILQKWVVVTFLGVITFNHQPSIMSHF